jgi:hypothetical protein
LQNETTKEMTAQVYYYHYYYYYYHCYYCILLYWHGLRSPWNFVSLLSWLVPPSPVSAFARSFFSDLLGTRISSDVVEHVVHQLLLPPSLPSSLPCLGLPPGR